MQEAKENAVVKLLKQKLLWLAVVFVVAAIAVATVDQVMYSSNKLTNQLQSALNNGKASALTECCTSDYAEEMEWTISASSYLAEELGAGYSFVILGGAQMETDLEGYSGSIPTFFIIKKANGSVYAVSAMQFLTEEVNGKDYLAAEVYE